MRLHDPNVIDDLIRMTDERMGELPTRQRAEWLQRWADCLFENFQLDLYAEMRKRGFRND